MKIRNWLAVTVAAFSVAVTLAACGGGSGDSEETITLRLGTGFPVNAPVGKAVAEFADAVEEESDGRIRFEVFPGGEIGTDPELATALQDGTLDAGVINPSASGLDPRLQVSLLPFLVDDFESADALFYGDGFVAEYEDAVLEELGITAVARFENGFRGLTSNEPIARPDDMRGVVVRVPPAPLVATLFQAWGAQTEEVPVTELYTALEQGTVDAQENGLEGIKAFALMEVQDYFLELRHLYVTAFMGFSEPAWSRLSEQDQALITELAEEASLSGRQEARDLYDSDLATIAADDTVTEMTEDARAEWVAGAEPVFDAFVDIFGTETLADLRAAAEKVNDD